MCSKYVDEVWHTHILFTADYNAFCQQAIGHFVHHEPMTRAEEFARRPELQGGFKDAYVAAFGVCPGKIWDGLLSATCGSCGC